MLSRVLWILLLTAPAWARLGGGESYSAPSSPSYSGSSSAPSGGGGDSSQLIFFLLELLIRYPAVGIPVLLVVLFFWMANQNSPGLETVLKRNLPASTGIEVPDADVFHVQPLAKGNPDPNFSYYVFRDFIGLLYTQVQQGRCGDLAEVGHYLSPQVRESMLKLTHNQQVTGVKNVLLGAARILSQTIVQNRVRIILTLESNFTELHGDREERIYSKERWTFQRKAGVTSPGPIPVGTVRLGCPNCGQSGEVGKDGLCPYCDKLVNTGDYGWVVVQVQVQERAQQLQLGLGEQAPERGTNLPTRRSPQLGQRWRAFQARYPEFVQTQFEARLVEIFMALQQAWSDQQWERARPYETDSLYQTHRYWIEAYQRQGVVNQLSQIKVLKIELCNIETDAYFDAVTVRIFASMIDITLEKSSGRRLGGNPNQPRVFSEYWTLIRKVGYQPPSETRPAGTCPSCGAPLDRISQAGQCEYCGSTITQGDFDWVLAQIEQDESYRLPS
ncbi:MAG: Tim44 domain-containing protein [Candidatus Eremiobacteraeota bacterium]|nr:Tim44 domain-containing protein [Candidatus Eremiobacteraeota bacterium]MCW5868306.1 Tim44 domain-containing protein [Candidatus Eremiobacteraeota bacterium]